MAYQASIFVIRFQSPASSTSRNGMDRPGFNQQRDMPGVRDATESVLMNAGTKKPAKSDVTSQLRRVSSKPHKGHQRHQRILCTSDTNHPLHVRDSPRRNAMHVLHPTKETPLASPFTNCCPYCYLVSVRA